MNKQDFEAYADYKRFDGAIVGLWNQALADAVRRCGSPIDQVQLLDYGSGDVKYYHHLINCGLESQNIHGVEVSEKRNQRCRDFDWTYVRLHTPNEPLQYPERMFDVINCIGVIEHILVAEGQRVLGELRQLLRPGGVLLIAKPNYPIKLFFLCQP